VCLGNPNLSTEVSIRDLAHVIARVTAFDGEIVWDMSKPNCEPRGKVDTSRAKQAFGLRAQTPFTEGLHRMTRWYREQHL